MRKFNFQSDTKQATSSDEAMDGEQGEAPPWSVPTRDIRELFLAQDILRSATITDRPDNSITAHEIETKDLPASTSGPKPSSHTEINANTSRNTEPFDSEIADAKVTPLPSTSGAQKTMHTASVVGTRGSAPTYAAGNVVQSSASKSQDTCIPVGTPAPIDNQQNAGPVRSPVFRPNTIAALPHSNVSQCSHSNALGMSQPNTSIEMDECLQKNMGELLPILIELLKRKGSDGPSSSSPDSQATPSSIHATSTHSIEKITKLNEKIEVTDEFEETFTKTLQNDQDETGEVDEDCQQANSQDELALDNDDENDTDEEENPGQGSKHCADDDDYKTATTPDLSEYQRDVVEDLDENDYQQIDDNIPNESSAEDSQDVSEEEPSEFPELDDDLLRLEWSRAEKRRLSNVLRELSREIKTTELHHKKARLLKKGKVMNQAINNKISAINREIMTVKKKSLRHLALPLDQIQEYDWDLVANVMDAKRSPQECRMYWKLFMHPSINTNEWTQVEIKMMETIAQRHKFRNWNAIADELNTGRNGHQCYLFYRKNICPHTELRGKFNKK